MKTADDMKRRVLHTLGVLAAGQPIAIEDAEKIDLLSVAERLAGERIIDLTPWIAQGEIPPEYYTAFCDIVAADHAVIFGANLAEMKAIAQMGVATIERINKRSEPVQKLRVPTFRIRAGRW